MADPLIHVPSRKELDGLGRASFKDFLKFHSLGVAVHDDHFMGDLFKGGAAPGMYQSTASGTVAAVAAIDTGTVNGQILLDPGTDNGGRSDLSLGRHFRGNLNCVVAVRMQHNTTVGAGKVEVGFTDVVSGTDAGAVATKATPTFTADDAAILVMDTNDDSQFTLMGVAATTVSSVIDTAFTPTANTFYTYIVACIDTTMYAYILDAHGAIQYRSAGLSGGPTATVLLTPWVFCQNRSGARRGINIDRITVWQMESTS